MANKDLKKAKNAKKDEFYTQFNDIDKELKHYTKHFKDKIVYCNCDDPKISNFFLYFANYFWHLGLKKVICSCYKNNDANLFSQGLGEKGCYFEYNGFDNAGNKLNESKAIANFIKNDLKTIEFKGNGDFRSDESVKLLNQSDIVVTNPPFSLFREYVAQLVKNGGGGKKFIIIGNVNAVSYKEIFSLVKDGKLWLGASIHSGDREFGVPSYYPLDAAGVRIDDNGNKFIRVKGVRWLTNLDYLKRHEKLETVASYTKNPEKYPKYDNYDAINVDKTIEIPLDYDGAMGVPITFLDKYNPEQFEILALGIVGSIEFTCAKKMEILDKLGNSTGKFTINAKGTLYRKFNPKIDKKPAFKDCETGELYSSIYARIIIKKRKDAQ